MVRSALTAVTTTTVVWIITEGQNEWCEYVCLFWCVTISVYMCCCGYATCFVHSSVSQAPERTYCFEKIPVGRGGMGYKNSSANAGKQFYLHVHPLSFTRKCLCNCVSSLFLQGEREWKIMHSDSPVLLISLQGKRFAEHNRWCNCRKTQAGAEKENIPQCLWEMWLNKNHWTYSMSEFNSHKAEGGFSQQAS